MLVKIDPEYIADEFNLIELKKTFPEKGRYSECLKLLKSKKAPSQLELNDEAYMQLNQDTSDLYGLIHSRYVYSRHGMAKVYQKLLEGVYGHCPRILCDK